MADIIYEIQKLQKERELFFTRSIEVENEKRKLEKQVKFKVEENKVLEARVLELEERLSFEHLLRVDIEDEVNRLQDELVEKNEKIENLKRTSRTLQIKLDKLEEIILKNASRNIYNISIGKADQLNGLLESGSQVIHTKSK